MSGKSIRVKKDLPLKARLTDKIKKKIKAYVIQANKKLGMQLYKNCEFKTYCKNYQGDRIKRVWTSKPNTVKKCFLSVPTLRDRILQMIIDAAVHPIAEYQADHNSFGFRSNRSTVDAITSFMGRLGQRRKQKEENKSGIVKVSKEAYNLFKGGRFRKRRALKHRNVSRRQREYFYDYYTCGKTILAKDRKVKRKPFTFSSDYHIITIKIRKCFDNIDHQTALRTYPLGTEYNFFLKA